MPLPKPHPGFLAKKSRILEQLNVPDTEYSDASPKGSVDAGIRDLIDEINVQDGLVTTSSCAGRVSVFVEGRKSSGPEAGDSGDGGREKAASTVGGKGGGGAWLFVSHDPLPEDGLDSDERLMGLLGLSGSDGESGNGQRLIHFKFEPMVCSCQVYTESGRR
jgi:tRNA wybutosine-synthesizing protein 3